MLCCVVLWLLQSVVLCAALRGAVIAAVRMLHAVVRDAVIAAVRDAHPLQQ